jgi:ABC-2 type transport system ATP-binding protein
MSEVRDKLAKLALANSGDSSIPPPTVGVSAADLLDVSPAAMAEPSIVAHGLTKRFGSFTALDQLNLTVTGSKCVGFLGPNGAGKTTALKLFTDMIFPSEGEVFLAGVSVRRDRKAALANCGVLIETPEIYPSLTPREALGMVADLRGVPAGDRDSRIAEVLGEVRMTEWADQRVGRFSKGMKQRINIAAALVHDPQILLLDEPSTGLDPRGMAEVRTIIRGLKKSNRLIFMSSHILSEVTEVCDEVALLDHGHLLFHDTLENVENRFSTSRTTIEVGLAKPLGDADVAAKVKGADLVVGWDRIDLTHVMLHFQPGPDAVERLFEQVAALHLGVVSFREPGNALEEVYMSQIARGD